MKVKKITEREISLHRGTQGSAGIDLPSDEDLTIWPGQQVMIRTGHSVAIPEGYVGMIKDRSSMAWKQSLVTAAGVIDSDYRGEVRVVLRNVGELPKQIRAGDRIAQLVVHKVDMSHIEYVEDLDDTERGNGGFGSTGV